MLEAKRTLVKSGPELWAEVSDAGALARHLAPFGSVRITRVQPETLVEWEGEKAAGRVTLQPTGFGTRVVLAASVGGGHAEEVEALEAAMAPPPEPVAAAVADAAPPRGLWARLRRRRAEPPALPPAPARPAPAAASPPAMADDAALLVLTDTLDALGRAHHRPFSRA